MGEYERARTDARFGIIMQGLIHDSVFMHLYEELADAAEKDDENPRPAGG